MNAKIRNILYGYKFENGRIVIHDAEAKIVNQVFTDYVNGLSYLKISNLLIQKGIEFLPNQVNWNKNKVKRIIEDKRYLGDDKYVDNINDNSIELQIRIAEIDAEWQKVINATTTENENDDNREVVMEKLLTEKIQLKKQLEEIELLKKNKQLTMSRLDEIYSVIDLLRNHPITYDDQIVREILECVVVESKEQIKVVFKGGI